MLVIQFKDFGQKVPDYLNSIEAGLLSYERYYQRLIKTEQLKEVLDAITNELKNFVVLTAKKTPEFTKNLFKFSF
ncbi:unnamed protein product [marine sediment metagenome]|uniref:Uncharacterized protein n=1 Tax=marine sediment metagenome TaxID=412755 RepID=X1EVB5_9ZZZZ